jgi:hypothetical protein
MTDPKKDVLSLSKEEQGDIAMLEAEIADLERQKKSSEDLVQDLMAKEDPKAGVYFAQEIFQAGQDKLRLATEIEIRKKRINRIRLNEGADPFL